MSDDDEWISAGPELPRISAATTAAGRTINITWTTGVSVKVDLTMIIASHPAFAQLRSDDAYFQRMQVDPLGWAVFWPGDGSCAIPTSSLEEYAVPDAPAL